MAAQAVNVATLHIDQTIVLHRIVKQAMVVVLAALVALDMFKLMLLLLLTTKAQVVAVVVKVLR